MLEIHMAYPQENLLGQELLLGGHLPGNALNCQASLCDGLSEVSIFQSVLPGMPSQAVSAK